MDEEIGLWIVEHVTRDTTISDKTLNTLIKTLPFPKNNFSLNKSLLLRRIFSEIQKNGVSQNLLDLLEIIQELHHGIAVSSTDSIKRAYRQVAMECTVKAMDEASQFSLVVKRVWRGRVSRMGDCGLVSDELKEWMGDVEAALWDENAREKVKKNGTEIDAVGAVKAYLAEAWGELGPPFLDVVAELVESDETVKEALELGERVEEHRAPVIQNDDAVVSQNGTLIPRRNHVAATKCHRGSVAGTSRGAKISDPEQVDNEDLSKNYGCLPSPAIDEVQKAPKASSSELRAVVTDPLPEALKLAENAMSKKNKDQRNPEVLANESDPKRPCISYENNGLRPSLMTRNTNARTYEWDDSIDDLPAGKTSSGSRIKLPSPKNRLVSPLKKHEMKNLTRKRNVKWSTLEEETLIAGVKKYGRGFWKAILTAYGDVFKGRTDVDLKDKWRNMTR